MQLSFLIESISDLVVRTVSSIDPTNVAVTALAADSRTVEKGTLFVAIPGTAANGNDFIADAVAVGATCVVSERDAPAAIQRSYVHIQVSDARAALSRLSDLFFGRPSTTLKVVGVTGTNGKTTTHWMVSELLKQLGYPAARIGTLGFERTGGKIPGVLTTPDPISLHKFLKEVVEEKTSFISMEVSSHALDQQRVSSIQFDVGIFTNLTRDHLDYHGTMEQYAESKAKLFQLIGESAKQNKSKANVAIINLESDWGTYFAIQAKKAGCAVIGFRHEKNDSAGDTKIFDSVHTFQEDAAATEGTHFTLDEVLFESPFIGRFNVENLIAACLAVAAFGFPLAEIAAAAKNLEQVAGRLERIVSPSGRGKTASVFVDYAHTPDALEKAIAALKPFCAGNLWVVFGCGGDRDKGKRPLMFDAAKKYTDYITVTADNPRTEDAAKIIADVLAGGRIAAIMEVDRKEAIIKTLSRVEPGDTVLIAGKGHEDYQIFGTQKVYFSDQKVVRDFFNGRL